MRIRISHTTAYEYEKPAKSVLQTLRLMPRGHDGQHVASWRLELDVDGKLRAGEDVLGNIIHTLSVDGPIDRLSLSVEGDVETTDTHGIVSGTAERFPANIFLRETPLTQVDAALGTYADEVAAKGPERDLDLAHRLMLAIHRDVAFDTEPTHAGTTASEAFGIRRGVCQDLTHIYIAAARHLGLPARYVSGYFARADVAAPQDAGHAWAEALIPDLGWVGFDPANGICPTEAHVRVAIGLDYLGAAPVRGSRYGGGGERLDVSLKVAASMRQHQG
jgi:transglutaminase-like putative cysteine protease